MIEWGLQRLLVNVSELDYKAINLLSCMTLDVENCHSTVDIKQANVSMLEYCRSFGLTMKESIKRTTEWAPCYHTSRRSWYPKPEETISFSRASSYGAAVRQPTVRQETTMAKHGQDDERRDNVEVNDEEIEDDFDSSSDEEGADEDGNGGESFLQGEIGSSATFLFGARSRFGRVVRFNI
ncbi:hypothetical protein P5673_006196 [Acropora cervicornis]|uniref:Uncharacterized protein n=1 Tax=Acropora cervicornis TaxID=6130 RepID=A0AAD9VCV7_ACRCE|nr:hypothetical protein P5673_006196 [Acropora cervicornis]